MHDILIPIVRESLRAIVANNECCRLLKQALINAEVIAPPDALLIRAELATPCPKFRCNWKCRVGYKVKCGGIACRIERHGARQMIKWTE